jgi:PiT family inorganic phosphate transporter
MTDSFGFLVVTFIIILGFEAVNGWTDAPNAVATVISTRVLAPMVAVVMAAVLNLVGALSGTAVATTIGKGLVDQELVGLDTIAAAAAAVIIWSTTAWYFGLPTSESHGIVSGLAGAAVATSGGFDVLQWDGWRKVFEGVALAVVAGFVGAFLVMVAVLWLFHRVAPALVRRLFAVLQVLSSAFMAYSHGTADGQKAMGVMALAFAVYEGKPPDEFEVPLWIILLAASTMGVSTGLGGWRIIRTLGMKVTHLDTPQGFSAEAAAATTITISAHLGIPLSTTHTIGSAIMGVGATKRLSAVRWGVAYNIVGAWVLTFPICFGLGWLIAWLIP